MHILLQLLNVHRPHTPQSIFQLWENEEVTGGEVRGVGQMMQHCHVVRSNESKGRNTGVGRGIVMVKDEVVLQTNAPPQAESPAISEDVCAAHFLSVCPTAHSNFHL